MNHMWIHNMDFFSKTTSLPHHPTTLLRRLVSLKLFFLVSSGSSYCYSYNLLFFVAEYSCGPSKILSLSIILRV
ncbi:hypothetical protein HanRHA438_Chr05g0225181 [Helianthus annuus]|uniref:Uncharacterized protein n=1 Tax=Helianthus annuus TaxID=4232 RepID=A0A9K3IZF9_HELAN|nr:hypothetical protein HanXRQr2_Chr05g0215901 [Helianthus annuus]KAJ0570310.1 hypothetical protein HanHA300_Chr05g0176631 [Helianthus annuus]KAJ0577117.1 hypothetical protein HanIR_Chr05g0232221 [Helianthus annuus]KAJ0584664.1 hypothetical protein HanHA89_Chr05g0191201 [Helianthus annuus]KAJ0747241.1 hypothetical protein HanOQP8_Chr05g0187131 [Helianthus annuus]